MKEISRGPFIPKLSFRLLKERLEQQLDHDNAGIVLQAEAILQLLDQNPKLVTGFSQEESHHEYEAVIQRILAYLFPSSLTTNEIKSAMIPFSNTVLYCSERFKNIIENSDTDIDEAFAEMYKAYDDFNFIPYAVVLNQYYNYNVDFSRPLSLKIKPREGKERTYRVLNNADLIDIYPNENAVEITEEILGEILANAEDPAVWKKYFPKDSWTVEGFGLFNLVDTTLDNQIEEFKAHLIEPNTFESFEKIVNDIRGVFNIPDLRVGVYQLDGNSLLPGYDEQAKSMTIDETGQTTCDTYACDYIQEMLFDKHEQVILSDTESYQQRSGGNSLSSNLMTNGIKSIILIPIKVEDELAFVLEIGSDQKHKLNAINALKLNKLIPYIQSYAERVKDEFENQISAIIQRECTSIHPAVQWRFEEEAIQYFQNTQQGEPATFHEVVFEDVVPLYGQIDIVGSSGARNTAIQKDLLSLLDQSKTLLTDLSADQKLPFYEQLVFQTQRHINSVKDSFHSNTEQQVSQFFEHQLYPLFEHAQTQSRQKTAVRQFLSQLDTTTKSIYESRKQYDNTVDTINKKLSRFLDKKQKDAQAIFPHYFEKYKTDGIEHNLYIGQSITKSKLYHPSVMYNLRLWQLQVMCEMEAMYYKNQKEFAVPLNVASLVFAYDTPITIRYRIDEKKFDVDGAYNVRYEMIKKRIDKAHIKNTNERLTQPHILSVVYSNPQLGREYMGYFEFLQSIGYIGKHIEKVELEELQGASGMMAIRAEMNHELRQTEKVFSLEDLKTMT